MSDFEGKKYKKYLKNVPAYCMLACSVIILYIANRKMLFMMDDEWYSTNLVTGLPLAGLSDILESQIWHFFHWGGRSMAHGILQVLLLAGEHMADIVNVVCMVLLTLVTCQIAKTKNPYHYLLTFSLLIILNANWSQTLLWQSGAANYLYMTTIILFFIWCYLYKLENLQKRNWWGITVWIAPLGLMAGWSNENMGPAIWAGTVLVMLFVRKSEKKIYPWMVVGNIFCLLGSALVIAAPGNFARVEEAVTDVAGKGLLWRTFLRCFSLVNGLFYYLLFAVILTLLLIFLHSFILKLKMNKVDGLLLVMALLSWGAMILSPHYPDRASFGTLALLVCVIVHLFSEIVKNRQDLNLPANLLVSFIWLGGMFPLATYICQMIGWLK